MESRTAQFSEQAIAVSMQDVIVGYGSTVILENLTISIHKGERVVIAGGSGCGKSSLMRTIAGLQPRLGGSIALFDVPMDVDGDSTLDVADKMGILFQAGGMLASLTLAENVALPLQEQGGLTEAEIMTLVNYRLTQVGLDGFEDFLPGEISGGMLKRAGLARAMVMDPDILFLDEPSAGLDPVTAASLDELIVQMNETSNTTMVIVTHDLDSIQCVATRVLFVDKSKKTIIADGTPAELKQSSNAVVFKFFNRLSQSA